MRRGRKPFKAKDHIASFNKFRASQKDVPMSEEQLKEGLKQCGIPCNAMFCIELKKYNVVKKVGGDYVFISPNKPIHFGVLNNVYLQYYSKVKEYRKAVNEKKMRKEDERNNSVQAAIKLLKERGYEIFAPIGKVYAKM